LVDPEQDPKETSPGIRHNIGLERSKLHFDLILHLRILCAFAGKDGGEVSDDLVFRLVHLGFRVSVKPRVSFGSAIWVCRLGFGFRVSRQAYADWVLGFGFRVQSG
jgi:hypothetical protein